LGIQPSEAKQLTPQFFWHLWDAKYQRTKAERGIRDGSDVIDDEAFAELCEFWDEIEDGRS